MESVKSADTHTDHDQIFRWLKQLHTDDLDQLNELLQKILGYPDIISILPACLISRDDDIRRCTAFVMGLTGERPCVLPLLKAMQQDPNSEVRLNASAALHNFALDWLASGLWGEDETAWPRNDAPEWVQHSEWIHRWYFTLVTVVKHEPDWIPDLLALAQHDTETVVRCSAIAALAHFSGETTVPTLCTLLSDVNDYVRIEAITTLTLLKATSVVPTLVRQLDAYNEHVRVAALTALSQLGNQHILKPLLKTLQDPVPLVRINGVMAVFEIAKRTHYRDHDMVKALLKSLSDSDPYVVRNVIRTLGWVGDAQAVQELITLLKTEKRTAMMVNIVQALGLLKDQRAFKILAKMATSEVTTVRVEAVKALHLTGHPKAFGIMLHALNDASVLVKEQAAYALGFIGNKKAIKKLEKIREQYPYGQLRNVATDAIDRLMGFG